MIKPQIVSARELMALNTTELKRIGNWIYQPESLTLYNQEAGYEVDLEKINTPAEALDWILQIAGKEGPEWDIAGFIAALNRACEDRFHNSAQGVFCPFGRPQKADWRRGVYGRGRTRT
jgi:hypothetical protein